MSRVTITFLRFVFLTAWWCSASTTAFAQAPLPAALKAKWIGSIVVTSPGSENLTTQIKIGLGNWEAKSGSQIEFDIVPISSHKPGVNDYKPGLYNYKEVVFSTTVEGNDVFTFAGAYPIGKPSVPVENRCQGTYKFVKMVDSNGVELLYGTFQGNSVDCAEGTVKAVLFKKQFYNEHIKAGDYQAKLTTTLQSIPVLLTDEQSVGSERSTGDNRNPLVRSNALEASPGNYSERDGNATSKRRQAIYNFDKGLQEKFGKLPPLDVLGCRGDIVLEYLPELQLKRPVYRFSQNCGLAFDNFAAKNIIGDSYTIELYFRFDGLASWKRVIDWKNRSTDNGAYIYNGKLNFYNFIVSEPAPVKAGEYTHYVLARDGSTKQVKIYADGIAKIEFTDTNDNAVLTSRTLNFFFDDEVVRNEASAGAVAYIRLFDYPLPAAEVYAQYKHFPGDLVATAAAESPLTTGKYSIAGKILNGRTQQPITAEVQVRATSKPTLLHIDESGSFKLDVPAAGGYHLTVSKFGYTSKELEITAQENTSAPVIISLLPVEAGVAVTLKSIRFAQGKFDLLAESFAELDKLATFLMENGQVVIRLNGHTDNQGDPALNVQLSNDRVKAVQEYLISKGVASGRLRGKGFGGSRPVADNRAEQTRKLNRRVEFIILKN